MAEEDTSEEDAEDEDDGAVTEEAPVEVVAETEEVEEEEKVEDRELVLASADTAPAVEEVRFARRPPAPSPERTLKEEAPKGVSLVAAGEISNEFTEPLVPRSLADMIVRAMDHYGPAQGRSSRQARPLLRSLAQARQGDLGVPGGQAAHLER